MEKAGREMDKQVSRYGEGKTDKREEGERELTRRYGKGGSR